MTAKLFEWYRRPYAPLGTALAATIVALLFLSPIYLEHQWAAAQVATAPWYVALVRIPFFARLLMFTYDPAYWAGVYIVLALPVGAWLFAFRHWFEGRHTKSQSFQHDKKYGVPAE